MNTVTTGDELCAVGIGVSPTLAIRIAEGNRQKEPSSCLRPPDSGRSLLYIPIKIFDQDNNYNQVF